MFEVLSMASAVVVLGALGFIAFRIPALLIKPSTLFLAFYCLQVQISAAINAKQVIDSLESPWIFFLLVHGIALACLPIVFFSFRRTAESLYKKIGDLPSRLNTRPLAQVAILLIISCYSVVLAYLAYVPFTKTGLYALLFEPQLHDSYRQLSMRLISSDVLRYSFALLEKVLAPISAATCAILMGLAMRRKQRVIALLALAGIVLSALPAALYGARGPVAMVVLVVVFSWFLMFWRKVNLVSLAAALFFVLLVPVLMMVWKSESTDSRVLIFHTANILDRMVGRGYIDNVWHLRRVEQKGTYGILAIEKLASLLGKKPIDAFNEVAIANQDKAPVFGIKQLEAPDPIIGAKRGAPPSPAASASAQAGGLSPSGIAVAKPEQRSAGSAAKCDRTLVSECVDIRESASAGASFAVMNYAIFGAIGIPLSVVFILCIDSLLFVYARTSSLMVVQSIASVAVPVLTMSFSLFTTVMVSKGLALIPAFCFALGVAMKKCEEKQ